MGAAAVGFLCVECGLWGQAGGRCVRGQSEKTTVLLGAFVCMMGRLWMTLCRLCFSSGVNCVGRAGRRRGANVLGHGPHRPTTVRFQLVMVYDGWRSDVDEFMHGRGP